MRVCVHVSPPPSLMGSAGGRLGDQYTQRGVITVGDDRQLVYCPEPDLSNILSFRFDAAFDELTSAASVFQGTVQPLVDQVVDGHSATAIVCGEDAYGKSMLVEGRPAQLVPGLIGLAAEQLFHGLQERTTESDKVESVKVVRVSWYELGKSGVVDLLGTASGTAAGSASAEELKLQDDPQVGVTVPHLLEVEVKSASDVGELIRSLRRKGYGTPGAPHTGFSVFTLTVEGVSVRKYERASGSPRSRNAASASPRARLTFMTMPEVSSAGAGGKADAVPAWVRGLHAVLEGMEEKSPAIPFHRTRTTLLLRDALIGRIPSVMVAVVSPSIDNAAASGATLKFASRVRAVTGAEYVRGGKPPVAAAPGTGPSTHHHLGTSAGPGGGGGAFGHHSIGAGGGGGGGGGGTYAPAGTESGVAGVKAAWGGSDRHDPRQGEQQHQVGSGGGGGGAGDGASPPPPEDSVTVRAVKAVTSRPSAVSTSVPGDYRPGTSRSDRGLAALTPRGSRRRLVSASSSGNMSTASRGSAGGHDAASHGSHGQSNPMDSAAFAGDPLGRAEAIAARMAALSSQGDESAKWFTAMLSALEVSREETRSLRAHASDLERALGEAQFERNQLSQRLDLAVAELDAAKRADVAPAQFLKLRQLKEKLGAARQEIKDYELYKDVMETAVVRLKGEMQKLVDEREAARKDAARAHAHARREREQAVHAKKRVQELESELVKAQLTAENKLSKARASVKHQEHSLIAMRDQVLADNERLLRELQDTRDKLTSERRRTDHLQATVQELEASGGGGDGDTPSVARVQRQVEELRSALEMAEASNAQLTAQLSSLTGDHAEEAPHAPTGRDGRRGSDVGANASAARGSGGGSGGGGAGGSGRSGAGVGATGEGGRRQRRRSSGADALDRAQSSRNQARRAIEHNAATRDAQQRRRTPAGGAGVRSGTGPRGRDRRMYDVTKTLATGVTSRMAQRSGNGNGDDNGSGNRTRSDGAHGRAARQPTSARRGKPKAQASSLAKVAAHHKALGAELKRDMAAMREPEVPVRRRR